LRKKEKESWRERGEEVLLYPQEDANSSEEDINFGS